MIVMLSIVQGDEVVKSVYGDIREEGSLERLYHCLKNEFYKERGDDSFLDNEDNEHGLTTLLDDDYKIVMSKPN